MTWHLWRRERFADPVPQAAWAEDTYEQITDPFDEAGAYWDYRVVPDAATWSGPWMPQRRAPRRTSPFRSFRKHLEYGEDGWLGLELYARDGDNDGVISNADGAPALAAVTAGGTPALRLDTPRHTDAALVHNIRPLPRFYRVELRVGCPHFTLAELDGNEMGDPWSGAAQGNGLYFLAILDALPVPHNNTWIHPHKIVSIDSFVTAAIEEDVGRPGPVNVEYMGLRDYEGLDAAAGPNDFAYHVHCLAADGNHWYADNRAACCYRQDGWYDVMIERHLTGFTMSIAGRFDGEDRRRVVRGAIGFDEGKVWHYDRPGEPAPAFATNPATWHPGGHPHYFAFGVPHINWYRGHALFADLRVYEGEPATATTPGS
ncbi:MAG TPA: hypothetical protein VKB31_01815 [Trueperaceae bacterium]|nr:hypothetical protein [Trueperaceae bacterium]